ncbi:MAG: ABC transporter ATP-binding protein [Candidatus Micrarchaeia archaeon]
MTGKKDAVLRLENVTLRRTDSENVLEDISLEVYEGEILSVIGGSGAGKSTLLHALAGLLAPVSGRITFRGKPLSGPTAALGLVYQGYALFPWRTAIENVEFGLELKNIPRAARKQLGEEALDLLGMLEHRDKYPIELSGGMQQRVAIARVIVNRPDVLMLDEGFSALDVQTRRSIEKQIIRIQEELGITIILVTHLVEQALAISDRAVVIDRGKVGGIIELDGKRPRDIDDPEFRELLRRTETMIRPVQKMDRFVKDLKSIK